MTMKYVIPVFMTLAGFATAVEAQQGPGPGAGAGQALGQGQHFGPKFSAKVNVGVLKVEDRDIDPWAFRTEFGVDGLFAFDSGFKLKYDLLVDVAGDINDTDELTWSNGHEGDDENGLYVKDARVILITPGYGGILIAPRVTSGHWNHLYGKADIFEYNRFHGGTGDISFFGQPEQGSDTIGYASPKFGGFQFLAATLHLNDANGEDADAYAGRLMYEKGAFYAGVGHAVLKNEQLPSDEDYSYTTLTAAYDFGSVRVAGVYERSVDAPMVTGVTVIPGNPPTVIPNFGTADFDSYVATVSYDITPKWTLSGGYAHRNHDVDDMDLKGTILNLKYHFNDRVFLFAETGQYDEAPDNIATGIQFAL